MTMQAMVDTLENAGFETTKRYDSSQSGYWFRISKNDFHAEKFFEYPADVGAAERDKKQREFIDVLLDLWHRHYIECRRGREVTKCHELRKVGEDIDEHNEKLNSLYPKTYITTAGDQYDEFRKRMLNYTYGKFGLGGHTDGYYFVDLNGRKPEKVEFLWGRQNGKTQACLKYLEKELGKIPEKQIDFGGENNMNTIMSDILKNKPVYLTTESGNIPVKIESTRTSFGEPTQFEGRVLTAGEEYMRKDISGAQKLAETMRGLNERWRRVREKAMCKLPGIKNVIFSGPCTIVLWEDGTKTVVRCNNDVLDPEKGLAMAIAKKALGTNKSGSNYYDIFKKWLPKPEMKSEEVEQLNNQIRELKADIGCVLTPMEEE